MYACVNIQDSTTQDTKQEKAKKKQKTATYPARAATNALNGTSSLFWNTGGRYELTISGLGGGVGGRTIGVRTL